ncbi:hypothetical protein PR048_019292 [Dryococelus australis]|uniref:Uncharacterized protein n=1 Tax=Dryococelus australis TaxID=614101 RepID=A0ABQ9H372_9NEOP|nr:hypothetical protein PR048_019292 [Dryococelus australis]
MTAFAEDLSTAATIQFSSSGRIDELQNKWSSALNTDDVRATAAEKSILDTEDVTGGEDEHEDSLDNNDYEDRVDEVSDEKDYDYLDARTHFTNEFPPIISVKKEVGFKNDRSFAATSDNTRAEDSENTDYMFTEHPNDLVDILRHLIALHQDGDFSHIKDTNSIISKLKDRWSCALLQPFMKELVLTGTSLGWSHYLQEPVEFSFRERRKGGETCLLVYGEEKSYGVFIVEERCQLNEPDEGSDSCRESVETANNYNNCPEERFKNKSATKMRPLSTPIKRIAQNAAEEKPYDEFGKFVAAELRQLPQRQAILLQQEIQNCIIRSKLASLENVINRHEHRYRVKLTNIQHGCRSHKHSVEIKGIKIQYCCRVPSQHGVPGRLNNRGGWWLRAPNHESSAKVVITLILGLSTQDWSIILITSHQGEPGSIPGRVTPGFSQVGIVPDDAAGRRVFTGIPRFPFSCIPALLYSDLISLETSLLRASQIFQHNSTQLNSPFSLYGYVRGNLADQFYVVHLPFWKIASDERKEVTVYLENHRCNSHPIEQMCNNMTVQTGRVIKRGGKERRREGDIEIPRKYVSTAPHLAVVRASSGDVATTMPRRIAQCKCIPLNNLVDRSRPPVLLWCSRLVSRCSGVREVVGSNPGRALTGNQHTNKPVKLSVNQEARNCDNLLAATTARGHLQKPPFHQTAIGDTNAYTTH